MCCVDLRCVDLFMFHSFESGYSNGTYQPLCLNFKAYIFSCSNVWSALIGFSNDRLDECGEFFERESICFPGMFNLADRNLNIMASHVM